MPLACAASWICADGLEAPLGAQSWSGAEEAPEPLLQQLELVRKAVSSELPCDKDERRAAAAALESVAGVDLPPPSIAMMAAEKRRAAEARRDEGTTAEVLQRRREQESDGSRSR